MNTVGQILKDARLTQKISLSYLEKITKIKKEFLIKLENEDWNNLPEFPVVSGFVKNLASALNLSVDEVNAKLRRDYPPKKLVINPKPDIHGKFTWSPKITFTLGVGLLVILVLSYLGFEYRKFVKPPFLEISFPRESEVIVQNKVKVVGKTATDATLSINNQPIIIDQDGNFTTEIEVNKETIELKFEAVSRSGKVTEKSVNISVE